MTFLQPKHTCSGLSRLGKGFLSLAALTVENGKTSTGQPGLRPSCHERPGAWRATPGCSSALPARSAHLLALLTGWVWEGWSGGEFKRWVYFKSPSQKGF